MLGFRTGKLPPQTGHELATAELTVGVLTGLHMDGPLDFTSLKKRLGVADGVIGLHLEKLENIGYISATKRLVGRRPKTTYRLTAAGRKALIDYFDSMRKLLVAVEAKRRASR